MLFKGYLSTRVLYCIKAIAQRDSLTNILIQSNGIETKDICSRNRAFFIFGVLLVDGNRFELTDFYFKREKCKLSFNC